MSTAGTVKRQTKYYIPHSPQRTLVSHGGGFFISLIISIIEFNPFNQLTPSEKDDLKFGLGGLMWALGWRKQILGCYVKNIYLSQLFDFNSHYKQCKRLVHIIGTLFKNLARSPFQDNQGIMKNYNIPSFADLFEECGQRVEGRDQKILLVPPTSPAPPMVSSTLHTEIKMIFLNGSLTHDCF
ncbi:hypothetical protein VP01_221g4 [Puccinia sorghi]|uniref:Tet-like 2OG-Fe(II) oxygenase domain-containing protein n=1 Tax=Puccinia sorghi TaxID=27349 RepID=A0A0L6V8Y7_9BASI|nr:hypothetical protein VP01_221g4 [Puccinia sorghi]